MIPDYNGGMRTEFNQTCVYGKDLPFSPHACRRRLSTCQDCTINLAIGQADFLAKWSDPLVVLDRQRNQTSVLQNLLSGGDAFLLCGGPSANELPLEQLSRRGIWSMAVNNMAGHARVRPQAFVCSDPPSKFSHSIWLDPAIMKFIPTPKLKRRRGALRRKVNGEFVPLNKSTAECPNVWGFQRSSWLVPDDSFFMSDSACWGNHQKGADELKQPKTVCTMLLGIRLLAYLGAKNIYLVGVDFRMNQSQGYSFDQGRTDKAADSNNAQFAVVNGLLTQMQSAGVFGRFGVSIYNCFERSGLRAFPYLPFQDAINHAKGIVEDAPDLSAWYEK